MAQLSGNLTHTQDYCLLARSRERPRKAQLREIAQSLLDWSSANVMGTCVDQIWRHCDRTFYFTGLSELFLDNTVAMDNTR